MTLPAPIPPIFLAQACFGPSLSKIHLRVTDTPKYPTHPMCESTTVVGDYRSTLLASKICRRCLNEFIGKTGARTYGQLSLSEIAERIGVVGLVT